MPDYRPSCPLREGNPEHLRSGISPPRPPTLTLPILTSASCCHPPPPLLLLLPPCPTPPGLRFISAVRLTLPRFVEVQSLAFLRGLRTLAPCVRVRTVCGQGVRDCAGEELSWGGGGGGGGQENGCTVQASLSGTSSVPPNL